VGLEFLGQTNCNLVTYVRLKISIAEPDMIYFKQILIQGVSEMSAFLLFIVNTFVILVVGYTYLPCAVIWDRNWHTAVYFKLALCSVVTKEDLQVALYFKLSQPDLLCDNCVSGTFI
jgi:hypothetical protein